MKRFVLFSLLPLALLFLGWRIHSFPEIPNNTFKKGEFLKYRVHYGLINAGYGSLWIDPKRHYVKDRPCLHIECKGYTNSAFDLVYRVRDTYESFMDEDYLISLRFQRDIQEGKYKYKTQTTFHHEMKRAVHYNHKNQKSVYWIKPGIQDIISAYYYARVKYDVRSMKPGDRIALHNFIDRRSFDLWAEFVKREKIKVNGKEFRALRFKLLVEEAGLLTDGSKIVFWISDDDNKIPLRAQTDLLIGSMKMDITEWKNLKHPFSAKLSD